MVCPQKSFPFTILFCVILVTVYVIMVMGGVSWYQPEAPDLLHWGAIFAPFIERGEWWRLATSSFIHFGLFHLGVNVVTLWILGRDFERSYGSFLFVLIYLTGIVISATGSFSWNLFTISAGASGAIMAVAGAQLIGLLFVYKSNKKQSINAFTHLFFGVLFNIVLGLFLPFIDNAAHISGIIWGVIFGLLVFPGGNLSNLLSLARILSVILLMISVLFTFTFHKQPYRFWYYTMFNSFLSNDRETVALLNSNAQPDQPLISMAGINEATEIWNKNMEMLLLFNDPPDALKPDLKTLKNIFELRNKSLINMKKYIASGDLVFVDSIQRNNEIIKNLPPLQYWLVFEKAEGKNQETDDTVQTVPVTVWYDSTWKETVKENAVFFRKGNNDRYGNSQGKVKDYYLSGQMQMKGEYLKNIENGLFFYYNEDGSYSAYGRYLFGNKLGDWRYFDSTGHRISEVTYTESGELIKNTWGLDGLPDVLEGEGVLKSYYSTGALFETGSIAKGVKQGVWTGLSMNGSVIFKEKFKDDILINGESYDSVGIGFFYTKLSEPPSIYGGEKALKEYLFANLKYPDLAKKAGLHEQAIVKLTIDTNGRLLSAEPLVRIGYGCDEEAIWVLTNWKKYVPGKIRGQFEKMDTYVYVEFPPENNIKKQ